MPPHLLSSLTSIFSLTSAPPTTPAKERSVALIIMIPPGRLDGMEARGADERDSTIYDPVSRDCFARVGGALVCSPHPQRIMVLDMEI